MPNQGTESQFEATTIDRLLTLPRYRYQYGGEIVRESRALAALRDTLLPKLLSGELRVKTAAMGDKD